MKCHVALKRRCMGPMNSERFGCRIILTILLSGSALWAQKPLDPARWEPAIQRFEKADGERIPEAGGIVFVGSSSIRMWKTLESDFDGFSVVRRGFGGSQVSDVLAFLDRIVLCYQPRAVVLYAGDNDIAAGESAETVANDFETFVTRVHAADPGVDVLFIAIKPSLKRWALVEEMRDANRLIKSYAEATERVTYLDIDTPMLGVDGKPTPDLFLKDGLHLNANGYAVWTGVSDRR